MIWLWVILAILYGLGGLLVGASLWRLLDDPDNYRSTAFTLVVIVVMTILWLPVVVLSSIYRAGQWAQ